MTNWDFKTEQVEAASWKRSWRQEFFTDLSSDFTMKAHMERVTTLPDGSVVHTPLPAVMRRASQVASDPRVQQLQALMTELVEEWTLEDEAAAIAAAEPDPEAPEE